MQQRIGLSSIGAQIGLVVGVVLLGLLAVIGAGVVGLRQVERNITELATVSTVKSKLSAQLQLDIVRRGSIDCDAIDGHRFGIGEECEEVEEVAPLTNNSAPFGGVSHPVFGRDCPGIHAVVNAERVDS